MSLNPLNRFSTKTMWKVYRANVSLVELFESLYLKVERSKYNSVNLSNNNLVVWMLQIISGPFIADLANVVLTNILVMLLLVIISRTFK